MNAAANPVFTSRVTEPALPSADRHDFA